MSETESRGSGPERDRTGRGESSPGAADYQGPGAWGTWALVLLGSLFLIAVVATVHSIFATLGG